MTDLTHGCTAKIIAEAEACGCTVEQTAYILATAAWETAGSMEPVREAYYLGSGAEAYRKTLRYYPWYGRGFCQLTWEVNYLSAGEKLDLDFIADPDAVMAPEASAKIIVHGSMEGWFTGRALTYYVSASRCDFVGARRVINGTDRASDVAALAEEYLVALQPDKRPTVRRGSTGAAVLELQTILSSTGYAVGPLDGAFGHKTEAAVTSHQAANGLDPDGIVGPATWGTLL